MIAYLDVKVLYYFGIRIGKEYPAELHPNVFDANELRGMKDYDCILMYFVKRES